MDEEEDDAVADEAQLEATESDEEGNDDEEEDDDGPEAVDLEGDAVMAAATGPAAAAAAAADESTIPVVAMDGVTWSRQSKRFVHDYMQQNPTAERWGNVRAVTGRLGRVSYVEYSTIEQPWTRITL